MGGIPQAGTSDTLDTLADRGMFRNAYRNYGDHESLVGNITVASGGVAGIRWFEVNNLTSGTPSFVQQSTYQPDSTYRWMGSAAMDGNGNLALGFSASDATIHPQIRYAGRLATDPPRRRRAPPRRSPCRTSPRRARRSPPASPTAAKRQVSKLRSPVACVPL